MGIDSLMKFDMYLSITRYSIGDPTPAVWRYEEG